MIRKLAMFTFVLCVPAVMLAQTPEKKPTVIKKAPVQTRANDGQEMFTSYCAACHGREGKGDGPAAPALTPKPRISRSSRNATAGRSPRKTLRTSCAAWR